MLISIRESLGFLRTWWLAMQDQDKRLSRQLPPIEYTRHVIDGITRANGIAIEASIAASDSTVYRLKYGSYCLDVSYIPVNTGGIFERGDLFFLQTKGRKSQVPLCLLSDPRSNNINLVDTLMITRTDKAALAVAIHNFINTVRLNSSDNSHQPYLNNTQLGN